MATTITTTEPHSQSSVIMALIEMQREIAWKADLGKFDFTYCSAETTRNRRCKIENKPHMIAEATLLLGAIQAVTEPPGCDIIYDKMQNFLKNTYCNYHLPGVLKKLETWKAQQAMEKSDDAHEPQLLDAINKEAIDIGSSRESQPDGAAQGVDDSTKHSSGLSSTGPKPEADSGLADSFSGLSIVQATSKTTVTVSQDGNLNQQSQHYVLGYGIAKLKRQGSLRDDSPIFEEFYKHISKAHQAMGIVYILQHSNNEIFKIGFTGKGVKKRLSHSNNCYRKEMTTFYESPNAFACAWKAEKLAGVILRHENPRVQNCEQCGGGHNELFSAPKEKVLEIVKLMESFVQLPGYAMKDGKMRISAEGQEYLHQMCNFDPQQLRARLESKNQAVATSNKSGQNTTVQLVKEAEVHVSVASASISVDGGTEANRRIEATQASSVDIEGMDNTEALKLAAMAGEKVVRGYWKRVNDASSMIFRSRESTPAA